uniref:CCN family member 1 n=1 Tax=Anabas testudineus TaxID=64144 RepID=A0A7N6A3X7_ANATE
MGLWEDAQRSIPLIVSGHLFSSCIRQFCSENCHCPPEVPRCAAGVSLILDGCGCCKVCAQQLFEDCSKTQPCDHTKGLECNFGSGFGSAKGICRAKLDGRTCEYNNKIYQNGEIFRPNCKHQCTCMDGAVGCVSLCPHELLLPRLGCAKPQRVKVRGQCCEQVICPEETKSKMALLVKNNNTFRSHAVGHMVASRVRCVPQTSAWSPCSKTCGTGWSMRKTNNNNRCKLVIETQICEVRPCNQRTFSRLKKGQKCKHIGKASHPGKPHYSGCHKMIKQAMMKIIESCKCDLNFSDRNEKTPVFYRHMT